MHSTYSRREKTIILRVTEKEYEQITELARASSVSLSACLRQKFFKRTQEDAEIIRLLHQVLERLDHTNGVGNPAAET